MGSRSDDAVAAVAQALEHITGRRAHVEWSAEGAARVTVELPVQLDIDQSRLIAQLALQAQRVGLRLPGQPDGSQQLWIELES